MMLSKQKIVIAIVTCEKFRWRANAVRNTWLEDLPDHINAYFVYCAEDGEGVTGDSLYINCQEAYENLPLKMSKFFEYCQSNLEFDYLLKVDDDSYIDVPQLLDFETNGEDYIGQFEGLSEMDVTRTWHFGKCEDKSVEVPFQGEITNDWARGGGYLLSSRAVRILASETKHRFEHYLFEDMMVGDILVKHPDIRVKKCSYVDFGVLNPMPPKNMRYIRRKFRERSENDNEIVWGSFNRVDPISQKWGFDRGSPIDRYYIESFLEKNAEYVRGRVLEIKDDNYTKQFGSEKVTASEILDIDSKNERATLIADITDRSALTANQFDCVIFTQTLQLLPDPEEAIRNLHYILKPGGTLLVTCPGISKIQTTGPESEWFFFFTPLSLNMMLSKVFDEKNIEVHSQGNVFSATAFLWGLAMSDVDINHLDINDPNYPLLLSVKATKQ